jgi:hypothetical protein
MPDLLVNVVVKMNQDIEKDLIATHKDLMSVK